ncbi:NAD(P)H-dependent oxidoreductase [Marinicella meishanensis]|uniref:NAD(P)H-dependent oxidoreductase n=1 Tax=Marinicella meishanensis TaxID=2873263 RepID=UPI001CBFB73E|nr:NAD(P)H-dependent oxidoreductase [Marinicella sp. NBU2979]
MNKVLVLFAHPVFQTSQLNQALLQALPDRAEITVHDLYEHYPNFMIDVAHEQALLQAHDVIVFQHPLYWYSAPAILKEWMDLVLEHGFAYGTEGTALAGKQFLSVVTSGGDLCNYQGERNIRDLLQPFEYTAKLCHMDYLPPFIVYGALKIKAQNYNDHISANYLSEQAAIYQQLMDDLVQQRLSAQACASYRTLNEHFPGALA